MTHGALIVGVGLAVGLLGAIVSSRFLMSMVYGVSVTDRIVYLWVALAIVAVAVGSGFFPAWRASKVDPIVALRRE